ncbi:hypothetical protein [Parendozoicomonas haliclonae]|uniref:Cupin domain protein n=1 Tax=Parendozoicomonas haliclonae TaxID=1960125 RepID=A0A1X7AS66_9GAMM|nr:hypothetical protein [Parendozoicomonas haliclonae]SMA50949.1 hypothetical protein EHSB41UT_04767 [Parendozoicomonas haliclonae]
MIKVRKWPLLLIFTCNIVLATEDEASTQSDPLDAVIAAPDSHKVLLENESVRVLRVIIEPGVKEPVHIHKASSVMIVDQPAQIKYYGESDQLIFMTKPTDGKSHQNPQWLDPEGLHSVENIDNKVYKAYRIEIKE